MEMKVPRPGASNSGNEGKNKPPSRLQRRAPATLQLDANMQQPDNGAAPIPFLSPLVVSPAPLWEAADDYSASKRPELNKGGDVDAQKAPMTTSPSFPPAGWRHPALSMAAVEPASLGPLFEFQCSLMHNGQ
ncbi:hypothetical protein Cni_G15675 [Canna indica]|uniref:Uncharacterized protein n=1 Tax=Canna indica TaxID=4628 RepID=A0AAQ3KE86_9LILI|nr:hypothetical protein Cni_G15675 [Canna indica]